MSMKNSNDTIENRTRDLPACSAVPQPTAPPRALELLRSTVVLNSHYLLVKIVIGNFAVFSNSQLALFACVYDVLPRTPYQLMRLFLVEFCVEQEAVVDYFTVPYSHLAGLFEENHESLIQVDRCSGWGSSRSFLERKSETLQSSRPAGVVSALVHRLCIILPPSQQICCVESLRLPGRSAAAAVLRTAIKDTCCNL
jgi:hypothetical protein